jgi:glycosyltransferase involved in cell wall biosynthesis
LPDCFVVATLHEYLAICHRNGQFVSNGSKKLCHEEHHDRCASCFPEHAPGDFWLRKHFIQSHFDHVDRFVSPSRFLMQRYIAWGIAPDRISVIENGQAAATAAPAPVTPGGKVRFGYFGQITEYKGLDILLSAVAQMPAKLRSRLVVEVNGANLEQQGQWYQDLIERLRRPLITQGCLRWAGAYDPGDVGRRMAKVDWVVVPSIWWENSPMVIQEAFVHRRPVICSNIGGMAEKVRDGIDGLHFEVCNPLDLADVMTRVVTEPGLHARLCANLPVPPGYAACAAAYLALLPVGQRAGLDVPA